MRNMQDLQLIPRIKVRDQDKVERLSVEDHIYMRTQAERDHSLEDESEIDEMYWRDAISTPIESPDEEDIVGF